MNRFLKLYCLPGRLIAEYQYLWPKKGQLWVSDRRRGHGFVHFLYASGFYLAALVLISLLMTDGPRQQRLAAPQSAVQVTVDPEAASQGGQGAGPTYQGPATFAPAGGSAATPASGEPGR